jgi:hypothetical protein
MTERRGQLVWGVVGREGDLRKIGCGRKRGGADARSVRHRKRDLPAIQIRAVPLDKVVLAEQPKEQAARVISR